MDWWFVTFVTYASRIQFEHEYIAEKHHLSGIKLSLDEEITLTEIFLKVVEKNKLQIRAFNICSDHIHLILKCSKGNLSEQIRIIKGSTSYLFRQSSTNGKIKTSKKFWARKFDSHLICSDSDLKRIMSYIQTNRAKHHLLKSLELEELIYCMLAQKS